ncbi:MAG: Nicotinamide-nucleotide amidohydrolase PncC [Candidatus Erwinia impunctatus]|nr:Nicotinamide-nucleotide amidohydrolase PncC [Culicoides impunctatus]
MIKIEMLATGDEVLHGQIIDTNSAWLADFCWENGLPLVRKQTVGDNLDALISVMEERSRVADVLIVNGGLGPTSDDLSAVAAAKLADVPLVLNSQWLNTMSAFFTQRGRVMSDSNRKQAELPLGAEMLDNPIGTACGFMLRHHHCLIFFTPGVPSEFKRMVTEQILPRLKQQVIIPEPPVCLRLTTFGVGESQLATQIDSVVIPEGLQVGYRAAPSMVEVKLTGAAEKRQVMDKVWQQIEQRLAESIIFTGKSTFASALAAQLNARTERLVLSEGYSAGYLHWQLKLAGVQLARGEILPEQEEPLSETMARGRILMTASDATIALLVAGEASGEMNLVICTQDGDTGVRVRLNMNHYSDETRREVMGMMALTLLHRWLHHQPVTVMHSSCDITQMVFNPR